MTDTQSDPWAEITSTTDSWVGRRVDEKHPLDFYWAKDIGGKCLLVLTADCIWPASDQLPRLDGITLELWHAPRMKDPSLVLSLTRESDKQIFRILCEDLVNVTKRINSSAEAPAVVLGRLEKWRRLLRNSPSGLLTESEVLGLFGELICLRDEIAPYKGLPFGVNAWHGPDGARQDFSVNNMAVEVKTKLTTAQHLVEISSEEQLEPLGKVALYLLVVTLGKADSNSIGESLFELAGGLIARAQEESGKLADLLEDRFAKVGFFRREEYMQPKFSIVQKQYYRVSEGFPKIISSNLMEGIQKVRYKVELKKCVPFLTDRPWND